MAVGGWTSPANCSFCGRTKTQDLQFIAGNRIFICDHCFGTIEDTTAALPGTTTCRFCARDVDNVLPGRDGGTICRECLELCGELLPPAPS